MTDFLYIKSGVIVGFILLCAYQTKFRSQLAHHSQLENRLN
nr:MAG TPA: hypothetical protein [Caudoviricetes sp.]